MTIDHDAIAARVRNFLTTGQIFGIREVMSAYLDLYDEVKRLRADMDQGALDYCDLMTRHDAHFVAWQSAKSRAEKAEAERDRVAAEWAETSQRNYQRAKAAEAERDALRAALTIYAQSGNWRLGGCCDPNSPNFTGEDIARAALKGDRDE